MAPAPPAPIAAAPPPDTARVVFVQGGFDGWYNDHASIVDENGKLIGESQPDTWFSVDVPSGDHSFFGWQADWAGSIPFARGCSCSLNQCTEIAATRVKLDAGKTYYFLLVGVGNAGKTVLGGHSFDFVPLAADPSQWPPGIIDRLSRLATIKADADMLTASEGNDYRSTIVCMGEKRLGDPDPIASTTGK